MKAGTKVTVTNDGLKHFNLSGEVISVNETEKRAQVNLDAFGTWGFNYADLSATGCQNKTAETIKQKETGIVSTEKIKDIKTSEKMPYTKRGSKPVDDKPKRKYSPRKPKTI